MIIEAPTMEGAQASVQQTAEAIRNLLAKHPDPLLRGVVIVLTPGIRNTAYNRASFISDNFFVTGDSMIVKIGE